MAPTDRDFVTLVSLIPINIREIKVGLNPSVFTLPACRASDQPEVLELGEASFPIYTGDGKHIMQRVLAHELAESIIKDYCNSQALVEPDARPALFYVPGKQTREEVKLKHERQLKEALRMQRNWFELIIRDADDSWQRHHLHTVISDFERQVCRYLGWNREWLTELPEGNQSICPFCSSAIKPNAVVCLECKQVVNEVEFKKRGGRLQTVGA